MRRLLMVAFHFPPLYGSSGLQRTISFARYLPAHGWEPLVLSAHPRAYEQTSDAQLGDLAPELIVRRAFAVDTARHLAVGGRYPRRLALPDRWVGWCVGAVPVGLSMIKRYRPEAIWVTYPIASAHLIGLILSRLSGLPLVADYRDSMTERDYPTDARTWRTYRWIEQRVVARSAACVFTAPSARAMYRERYAQVPQERLHIVENGYDEEAFTQLTSPTPTPKRGIKLLHSGLVYPSERDPTCLFDAIAKLHNAGEINEDTFQLVLRSAGNRKLFRGMIAQRSIEGIVRLEPALPYRDALAEMMEATALLVLQARNCNHQIPAKLYEYIRTRRPILGVTDDEGDTAATLRNAGIDTLAQLDDSSSIEALLRKFLARAAAGELRGASERAVEASSRAARTEELVHILESLPGSVAARSLTRTS